VTESLSVLAAALPDVLDDGFPRSRADTRTALATTAAVRQFDTGETILRQGDQTFLTLVLDGYVAMRRTTDDGQQLIVKVVSPGEWAVILPVSGRPAGADAVALASSRIAQWRGLDVRTLAAADSGLAIDLLDRSLALFEALVDRFDSLLYHDATRRVARVLNVHARLFFSEPPVLTRAHLPMLVGTSREMTGRVLRLFESRGLVVRIGRDRLRLLDPLGLATAAEHGGDRPPSAEQVPRHDSGDE
jgi:CRP-like cAMP-binding protein